MSTERYEYVKAIVECGELRLEYRLVGSSVVGRDRHDDDVSEWSDTEIIDVVCSLLSVDDDNRDVVTVEWN